MKNKTKRRLGAIAAALAIIAVACGLYLTDCHKPDDVARRALIEGDDGIRIVDEGGAIRFVPEAPTKGLIFYPGGKVQCEAYAPLMRKCAENGMLCVLVRMPGNLAFCKPDAADAYIGEYPEIERWTLAGHSLGGVVASMYAYKHPEALNALVLLGAYSTRDLRDCAFKVVSTYGSEDGVLDLEAYEKNRPNLPADAVEIVIEGGNHAGFGSYGAQEGDGNSALPEGAQIEQTAALLFGADEPF